jgi:photosystem II stability/assembly factor-like uncharacterized protein
VFAALPATANTARDKEARGERPAKALLESALPIVVMSPDGVTRWRAESAGVIARSRDGGVTWQRQGVGVVAGPLARSSSAPTPLAGSSSAPTTCWFVGQAGLVLLTTDGERWGTRPFPERVDLVAVDARDSRSATVTARDGRRFGTADGGATWTPAR